MASVEVDISNSEQDFTSSELQSVSTTSSTTDVASLLRSTTLHSAATQLFISDQDYITLAVIYSVLCSLITFSGCFGNAVTIVTYFSMKLKDGVMISFLCLAISDLLYGVTILAHLVSVGLSVLELRSSFSIWFPIDPFGIYVFFSDIGVLIYLITVLATTFIAIIRCLCVAKPLQFQNILTKRRSIVCAVAFSIVAVASYLPILVHMKMERSFDANINATRYRLRISPQREVIKTAIWIPRDVLVTLTTEIIVIVCVVIMMKTLRSAAKFRNSAAKYSVQPLTQVGGVQGQPTIGQVNSDLKNNTKHVDAQSNKLTSKDFSVVRQVVLISIVYIVCNMPKVIINVAVLFVPDLALGKPYQNVYFTIIGIMELFQAFNSSFNIFIYFKYNSKFRKHLCLSKIKT
ncbi:type-1B angiotensin II receptor [Biomphalaria glabrata]|nr:type-1B angiotensin II receptor-like [Biomphalaria glabrata]